MNIKNLVLGLSALVFLIGAVSCDNDSRAQGSQIQFSNNFAGSFVNGTTDANNDGISAAVLSLQGLSLALGPNTISSKIELEPLDPPEPCITPNGGAGIDTSLVQAAIVITLDDNDQILVELNELEECVAADTVIDPSFSFSGDGAVTGGSGEFEGATGTVNFSGTGVFLISETTGFYGSTSGLIDGVIELN